ncbi:hypothetical protein [Endozoicomonas ascidiicola]|uniref:hypothetical protein n=1 Tax=Endozoicomonas ascidiicola TaxID=1698521 RepID=UPI0008319CC3|nr:hypothetical protein [Endozoicomonas ascidiicola]
MQSIDLLSSKDIIKTVSQIDDLQNIWEQRNDKLPFYTLGAASYLDSSKSYNKRYYKKADRLNPILANQFSWLYEKVLGALTEATGLTCQLAEHQALPGFHIFLAHKKFLSPVASRHVDRQHIKLNWTNNEQVDLRDVRLADF